VDRDLMQVSRVGNLRSGRIQAGEKDFPESR
jgi:hypothetical protein